jgi:hypothetical protein
MHAMLTTIDNPFSPLTDFDAWNAYDISSGYHTMEFLGRIVMTSDDLSEADYDAAIDEAIDEIIFENVSGIYRKISKEEVQKFEEKEMEEKSSG